MKKLLLLALSVACLATVFILLKDEIILYVKTFEGAFQEVEQWKDLM